MKCLFLMIILGFHIEMFLYISIFLYIYIKKAKACLGTKTLFLIMKSTSLKGPPRSMQSQRSRVLRFPCDLENVLSWEVMF